MIIDKVAAVLLPEKLNVNGVQLATEVHGDRANAAVVLLHGAGQTLLAWPGEFIQRLVDGGRCVIRFDSRDAGQSTSYPVGAPDYTLQDLAVDAAALVEELDFGHAHIVGMSQGAAVAQLMAIEHTERVASLTLIGSTPGGPGHEYSDLPEMAASLQASFAGEETPESDWNDRAAVVKYLVEGERLCAASSCPFDEEGICAMSERVVDYTADIAALMTNPFVLDAGRPWRNLLGQIGVPTLVLHGTEDPLFPIGHGHALAAEIPDARLIELSETGHEIVPPQHWDLVIPEILKHTSRGG